MVQGHLRSDAERYGALRLTPKSRSLLKGEERIRLRQEVSSKRVAKVARAPSYQIASEDEPLWEVLREHGALGKYEARPSPGERATGVAGTAQTNSLD